MSPAVMISQLPGWSESDFLLLQASAAHRAMYEDTGHRDKRLTY